MMQKVKGTTLPEPAESILPSETVKTYKVP